MADSAAATLSVVLPCRNEAGSVGLCVHAALQTLAESGIKGEVVVVDNGSTDRSAAVARAAGARVVYEHRPGYGRALRTGISAAEGQLIVMADADWSYDLEQLPRLIEPLLAGDADIVLGSRLEAAPRKSMPFLHRYIGTPLLSFMVRRAAGIASVTDSQSGYRAFRKESALRLGLRADGMEFASEMLIRAAQQGMRIAHVPTGYRNRIGNSKLNTFVDGWRHVQLILLLAPQLLLLTPGIISFLVGVFLSVLSFVSPSGLEVGSVRWQPVFFSSIAVILGLQSALIGAVLANRSSFSRPNARNRWRFVASRDFQAACGMLGVGVLLLGLGIDALLFIHWASGGPALRLGFALASSAQSLLISGASLISFSLIMRWLDWQHQSAVRDVPAD